MNDQEREAFRKKKRIVRRSAMVIVFFILSGWFLKWMIDDPSYTGLEIIFVAPAIALISAIVVGVLEEFFTKTTPMYPKNKSDYYFGITHPFLNKNKLLFFGYILVCGIIGTTGAVLLGVEINIQTVIAVTVWAFFVLGFIGAVIMTTFDGK